MGDVGVVILAGGKSERFGRDKATATLRGKAFLTRVAETASEISDEVIVTVADTHKRRKYEDLLARDDVEEVGIIVDDEVPCAGPLRGILTGLRHIEANHIVTVPCDVPLVKAEVLRFLSNSLGGTAVAVPTWSNGSLEPLMGAFERCSMLRVAEALCLLGRVRSDDLHRAAPHVRFLSIHEELKKIDPDLETFLNINVQKDLEKIPRVSMRGDAFLETADYKVGMDPQVLAKHLTPAPDHPSGSSSLDLDQLHTDAIEEDAHFWAAAAMERKGDELRRSLDAERSLGDNVETIRQAYRVAAELFSREAQMHGERKILFLAAHALQDEENCWRKVGYEQRSSEVRDRRTRIMSEIGLS